MTPGSFPSKSATSVPAPQPAPRPGVWDALNRPFTIWVLSVLSAIAFALLWRPFDLNLVGRARAAQEHSSLHVEVKSRLMALQDGIAGGAAVPEVRRSLEAGAAATINPAMETRSLRSLALEHDEIVASGGVSCPVDFVKGVRPIYENLRSLAGSSTAGAKIGVSTLLGQIGGGDN